MNFWSKKGVKSAVIVILALIFSLVVEVGIFIYDSVFEYSEDSFSLLDDKSKLSAVNYQVDGNTYTPSANDPQLVIHDINKEVKSLVISFSSKNYTNASLQVFYKTENSAFNETDSLKNINIPNGATDMLLILPENVYDSIRIDIDGKFDIKDIVISGGDAVVVRKAVEPFSILRFSAIFILSFAFLFLVTFVLLSKKSGVTRISLLANKLFSFLKNAVNTHPILTLLSFITLSSCIVFFQYLFCKEVFVFADIGGDTQNVYYPFFASLQRKVASHDFTLWDFTHGLGTNAITRQADIGSIFSWILCLFGANKLKYAIVLVHILKVLITGLVGYLYLNCFKLSNKVKVTVAYVFAFNGFMMLWGQHYFFATACSIICFLFFAVEKCLVSKKGYLYLALGTFFCAFNSYYYAYMMLIVTAVYALFRLIATHTIKDTGKCLTKIAFMFGSVLLGIAMAACLFLPSVNTIVSTSARLGGERSFIENILYYLTEPIYDNATTDGILTRFFSNNLYGASSYMGVSNYYEMPQWFFTSFMFFFASLFVTDAITAKTSLKTKILKLSSVAIIVFLAFHPLLSVVLNGFVAHFFRYTYLIMPLFAVCMALMLEKLFNRQISKLQICISGLIEIVCLIYAISTIPESQTKGMLNGLFYLLLALAFVIILFVLQSNRIKKASLLIVISFALIFTNVITDSYVTNNRRIPTSSTNSKIYQPSGNNDVKLALEHINSIDKSFFRTDKTFQDIAFLNDSMLQGYYGVSVYNSVVNKDIIDFVDNVCPDFQVTSANGYYDFREIYDDVNVISLLGVKYILTTFPLDGIKEYEHIHTVNSVMIYRNTACTGIGKFYSKAITYEDYALLSPEKQNSVIEDSLIMENAFNGRNSENSTIIFNNPKNHSELSGFANIEEDGYIMLPIPNEKGWKAYIDGKEAEIESADYAFMAIKITKGQHTVELKYNTPFFTEGLIVSICAFVLYGTLWLIVLLKNKRRQKHDSF